MDAASNPLTPPLEQALSAPAVRGSLVGSRLTARRLQRLRTMPFSELIYRGRQEAAKLIDRLVPPNAAVDAQKFLRSKAPEAAGPETALDVLRRRMPARFFAGASAPGVGSQVRSRFPQARAEILDAARGLLESRFDLLGYRNLWFGDPVDWHLDPVWSKRSPLVHWSLIDPLDPDVVGDSKVVWELNRHQWLIRLAQAWTVTGDDRYAAACVGAIDSWRDANPPAVGINWASSLEVAYRIVSWCWTVALIRQAPSVTGKWMMTLLASIWQHANHVRQYLSYYSSPNTHLTGEALGLFYAGTLFPEFHDAAEWREIGTRILLDESRKQVLDDGVHFELSTCYQRYTIETYLHFLLLAARNDIPVPRRVFEQVGEMIEYLLAIRQPDGTIPAIGDSDGGTLLPLVARERGDSRGVFATAAAIFRRPEFAWAADEAAPEVLWLLGTDGLRAFDAVTPAPPADSGSRLFPSSGYAVMRTGWQRDAHQLIVDAGALGCPASSGHGHADLLSVQCAIFGEPCLVDAGTYCYTPEPAWRDYFRSAAAHNTLLLDGQEHALPAGPFHWEQRPKARVRAWHSNADFDLLDAEHGAYARLADPVTCRRRVIFVKPDYWLIADDLNSDSSHDIEMTFQFAPAVKVSTDSTPWIRVETPHGNVLWMLTAGTNAIEPSIKCGERHPIRGWVSPEYGVRQPAPMLVCASRSTSRWRALTLLMPDGTGAMRPPRASVVYDKDGVPVGFDFEASHQLVRIGVQ